MMISTGQPPPSTAFPPMARETLTLVGRSSGLTFDADTGIARWTISIRHRADSGSVTDFNLKAIDGRVLEQFKQVDDGQLIGVIAELPPVRQRVPGAQLLVQRLEILGKPKAAAEVA